MGTCSVVVRLWCFSSGSYSKGKKVELTVSAPWKCMGDWMFSSAHSSPRHHGGGWSPSRSLKGWVGPSAGLDVLKGRKVFALAGILTPDRAPRSLVTTPTAVRRIVW